MKKTMPLRITAALLFITAFYWLPFAAMSVSERESIENDIEMLPGADAVIVFGAVMHAGRGISPLMKERLEAGISILKKGKASRIVVSNMKGASEAMAAYLYARGIPREAVEIDPQAERTPDSCRFEREGHPEKRRVIFVSQGFHLPRLIYQCRKAGVEGRAFPAEKVNMKGGASGRLIERLSVRAYRYLREALLAWLAFLGIYA